MDGARGCVARAVGSSDVAVAAADEITCAVSPSMLRRGASALFTVLGVIGLWQSRAL
jgi:hypothetical protein